MKKPTSTKINALDGTWKITALDTPAHVVVGGEDSFLDSAVGTTVSISNKLKIGEKTFCEKKFELSEQKGADQLFVVLQEDKKRFPGLENELGDILNSCKTNSGSVFKFSDAGNLQELDVSVCDPDNDVTFLITKFFVIDKDTMLAEYQGNYLCLKKQ